MNMFHVEQFGRHNPLFISTAVVPNERFVLVGVLVGVKKAIYAR
jgi:hypothetical protein